MVVHGRPDLVRQGLGDVADGRATGHPGGGPLRHLELRDPALGRLAGFFHLRPRRSQVGRDAIDLGAAAAEAHHDETEREADKAEGDELDHLERTQGVAVGDGVGHEHRRACHGGDDEPLAGRHRERGEDEGKDRK